MISGNHDSARRLGFGAHRQALGGVHLFTDDRVPAEPEVFAAGDERVALVAVPYLDPMTVPAPLPAAGGSPRSRTHAHVLSDALDAGRNGLKRLDPMPAIAVVHATIAGATPSDSEKTLAIGGADAVDAGIFAEFDYVALGHFHRPQSVAGTDHIVYSGSPLPYSFSEDHQKSVRLLTVNGGAIEAVRELPIPVGRPVATLEGSLEYLLTEPHLDKYLGHWVAAKLTDTITQIQPMERLRHRFPYAVAVRYERSPGRATSPALRAGAGTERRPTEEIVLHFLTEVRGDVPEPWARDLVLEAVEASRRVADT
jgi:exonuclease SbcD